MPRGLDVVLSLTAVVALLPVMALITVLNYVFTGTVLYRQERIGRGLRPFIMLKFQTMHNGADRGGTVTVARDDRITPLGRLLRAVKLDEVPQLFNVLRGDMSLVGPRALPANEVAQIPPAVAAQVYAVRPGLTGLASLALTDEERVLANCVDPVGFYYDSILPQKMAWESHYVRLHGFAVDVLILASTPVAILFPEMVRRMLCSVLGGTAPAWPTRAEKGHA
jgi:lipopolysaccharide/colanic/teichoic acid biosynthesis glycosyltransferase